MSRVDELRKRNSEKSQRTERLQPERQSQPATSCCGQAAPVKRPGFVKRAKTVLTAAARFIGDGAKTRSPEEQADNLAICNACPLLDGHTCNGCGCDVRAKVQLRLEECPAGKWFPDLLPIKPLIDPVRHLLHCCLPVESSEMWKWNLDQLAQRQEVFTGRRVLAIIHEPSGEDIEHRIRRKIDGLQLKTVEPQEVIDHCTQVGLRIDEYRVFENVPKLGEVVAFQWLLESVESLAENETAFYSHSKGVTRSEPDLKRWPGRMYRVCLDDMPTVDRALERASFAGCFFREVPHGRSSWHPSGTFGWYRSKDLYIRKTWRQIEQQYYGTESYFGTQFKRHEAICLAHDKAGNVYADSEWASVIQPQADIWEAARVRKVSAAVIAPLRGPHADQKPWEGSRPWDGHRVTAIIPTLEWSELLEHSVESLLLQTERPLIVIVDTGSVVTTDKLQAMRTSNQIEVLSIPLQGWIHPSEPVASAIEAAWSTVHTQFCYLTHNDCILKRREMLAEMVALTETHKAVGYQITERPYPEWTTELGHTCTMLDVDTMDRIGMAWNMRAFAAITGQSLDPEFCGPNKVDTERLMNLKLREAGIVPYFIGTEANYERTNDSNIDHCRSRTSGLLYSPQHSLKSEQWETDAITQAKKRHAKWTR